MIVAIIIMMVVSGTLRAQDSLLALKWNSVKAEIAERLSRDESIFRLATYNEKEISIEAWMTDLKSWATDRIHPKSTIIEEETGIESWMTEPYISKRISCSAVELVYEEEVPMESWMSQPFNEIREEEQRIEPWMTQPFAQVVEEEQSLEPWMSEVASW